METLSAPASEFDAVREMTGELPYLGQHRSLNSVHDIFLALDPSVRNEKGYQGAAGVKLPDGDDSADEDSYYTARCPTVPCGRPPVWPRWTGCRPRASPSISRG